MGRASFGSLTRRKWRELGYYVEGVEHISRVGPHTRRHDLFGFVDYICLKPGEIVLIQVTSWNNVSDRVNKIACGEHGKGQWATPMIDLAKHLLSCAGIRIVVEGWRLNKTRYRWESREVHVTPLLLDGRRRKRCPTTESSRSP